MCMTNAHFNQPTFSLHCFAADWRNTTEIEHTVNTDEKDITEPYFYLSAIVLK